MDFQPSLPESIQSKKGFYDSKTYPLEYLRQVNVLTYLSNTQESVQQSSPYVYLKSDDPKQCDLKKVPRIGGMA